MSTVRPDARTQQPPLSAALRAQVGALTAQYAEKRAACVEALKLVQQAHRWVNDAHLRELAGLLDMSVEELDAVATFYNLIYRRAVGRHVILYCDSVSCWVMGYETVYARLQQQLGVRAGETTADGRFTLLPSVCLGCCDGAPAMMIDADLHTNVRDERLAELLEPYS